MIPSNFIVFLLYSLTQERKRAIRKNTENSCLLRLFFKQVTLAYNNVTSLLHLAKPQKKPKIKYILRIKKGE